MTTCSFRRRASWLPACILALAATPAFAQDDDADSRKLELARREAVILWVALGIASVFCIGIGLIWGVSRGARRLLKKRESTPTDMPDIWYLNPPDKRKQDDP